MGGGSELSERFVNGFLNKCSFMISFEKASLSLRTVDIWRSRGFESCRRYDNEFYPEAAHYDSGDRFFMLTFCSPEIQQKKLWFLCCVIN